MPSPEYVATVQDQQYSSMTITTSPNNFILIQATPNHHRNHPDQPWTTQSHPDPAGLARFTTGPPTLLQVNLNQSWLLHASHNHFRPSLYHHRFPNVNTCLGSYSGRCFTISSTFCINSFPGERDAICSTPECPPPNHP